MKGGKRFKVVVWHGEGNSTFMVVDTRAPEDDCPAVVSSHASRELADYAASVYNAVVLKASQVVTAIEGSVSK